MALIVGPSVLFFVFTAPFYAGGLAVLPVLVGVLLMLVLASLCATGLTDPGVLPRAPVHANDALSPLKKIVNVKGRDIESKFCQTCQIYKPPRCTHCSICNNCVDRFDHHCPWTSNCIGRRNYRFFLIFVFSVPVYAAAIMALCIGHVVVATGRNGSFQAGLNEAPVSFALIFYSAAAMGTVGFLMTFHCQLLCASETTNERLTYKFLSGNPFKQPYSEEVRAICCGASRMSFVRWSFVPEEEQVILPIHKQPSTVTEDNFVELASPTKRPDILDNRIAVDHV